MFEINRFKESSTSGFERKYTESETLEVEVSAYGGISTQPATLISLGEGKGMDVIYQKTGVTKHLEPKERIWTSVGYADAS